MAVVGVADQYMILMAISLLFTVLALSYRDNIVLSLLAGVTWLASAIGHFGVGDKTSALTYSLAFLFLGFSIIFIYRTIKGATRALHDKRYGLEL